MHTLAHASPYVYSALYYVMGGGWDLLTRNRVPHLKVTLLTLLTLLTLPVHFRVLVASRCPKLENRGSGIGDRGSARGPRIGDRPESRIWDRGSRIGCRIEYRGESMGGYRNPIMLTLSLIHI